MGVGLGLAGATSSPPAPSNRSRPPMPSASDIGPSSFLAAATPSSPPASPPAAPSYLPSRPLVPSPSPPSPPLADPAPLLIGGAPEEAEVAAAPGASAHSPVPIAASGAAACAAA